MVDRQLPPQEWLASYVATYVVLCYLLGIRDAPQLAVHPQRGPIFENWVIAEVLKHHRHRGLVPSLHFYRERAGAEVDLVVERGADRLAVEIKAAMTPSPSCTRDPNPRRAAPATSCHGLTPARSPGADD